MSKNIVGNFIPTVFIDRITLENGGHTPKPYDDPHVLDTLGDLFQAGTNAYVGGSFAKPGTSPLKVTIQLSLKEYIKPNGRATWFEDVAFHKYFKIMVFQSTEILVTRSIMRSIPTAKVMMNLADGSKSDIMYSAQNNQKVAPQQTTAQTQKKATEYNDLYDNTTVTKFVNLGELTKNKDLTKNYKTVMDNGAVIYSVPFTLEFDSLPGNLSDLAYFAVVQADMDALKQDFPGFTLPGFVPHGKIAGELVFDKNKLVSTSYGFVDLNGAPWAGDVHQMSDGAWMTGKQHTESSVPLVKQIKPNTKVQDFRNFDAVSRLQLNLSTIENKLILAKSRTKSLAFDVQKKNAYFSDISLSRDNLNNVRFLFAFDLVKYAMDHSLYGKLYEKDSIMGPALLQEAIRIKTLKIVRRRVKEAWVSNKVANRVMLGSAFDDEEPIRVLVTAHDSQTKSSGAGFTLITSETPGAAISELNIFSADTRTHLRGVRHFSGIDRTMNDLSDGTYQYGIELEVEDRTADILKSVAIASLNNAVNSRKAGTEGLRWYLNEGSKPNSQFIPEGTGGEGVWKPSSFDVMSNRFSQGFINQMIEHYGTLDNVTAPWINGVSTYITFAKLIFGQPDSSRGQGTWNLLQSLINPLMLHCHPETGNPRGVMNLIKLIEDLIATISSMAGIKTKKLADTTSTTAPRIHFRSPSDTRVTSTKYFFKTTYDADIPNFVGFDYLSTTGFLQNAPGTRLKTMTEVQYRERTKQEFAFKHASFMQPKTAAQNAQSWEQIDFVQSFLGDTAASFLSLSNVNLGLGIFYSLASLTTSIVTSEANDASVMDDDETKLFNQMMSKVVLYNQLGLTTGQRQSSRYNVSGGKSKNLLKADVNLARTLEQAFVHSNLVTSSTREARFTTPSGEPLNPHLRRGDVHTGRVTDHEHEDITQFKEKWFQNKDHEIYDINPNTFLLKLLAYEDFNPSRLNESIKKFNQFLNQAGDMVKKLVDSPNRTNRNSIVVQKYKNAPTKLRQLMTQKAIPGVLRGKNPEVTAQGISDDPEHLAALMFKYGHIKRVQVFAGFEISEEGHILINSPIWNTLTDDHLKSLPGTQNLFCRIVSYDFREHTGESGFVMSPPEIMKLPIYDEHFLIQAHPLKGVAATTMSKSAIVVSHEDTKNKLKMASQSLTPVSLLSDSFQSAIIGEVVVTGYNTPTGGTSTLADAPGSKSPISSADGPAMTSGGTY